MALLIQETSLILYRVYTTVTVSVQCTLQQYWHEHRCCSWLHAGLYCIALQPFTRFVFFCLLVSEHFENILFVFLLFLVGNINYFHGWGVPPPIRGKFRENNYFNCWTLPLLAFQKTCYCWAWVGLFECHKAFGHNKVGDTIRMDLFILFLIHMLFKDYLFKFFFWHMIVFWASFIFWLT